MEVEGQNFEHVLRMNSVSQGDLPKIFVRGTPMGTKYYYVHVINPVTF